MNALTPNAEQAPLLADRKAVRHQARTNQEVTLILVIDDAEGSPISKTGRLIKYGKNTVKKASTQRSNDYFWPNVILKERLFN